MQLESISGSESDKAAVVDAMTYQQDRRYFIVGFRSGGFLGVYPKRENSLQFDTRVIIRRRNKYSIGPQSKMMAR